MKNDVVIREYAYFQLTKPNPEVYREWRGDWQALHDYNKG